MVVSHLGRALSSHIFDSIYRLLFDWTCPVLLFFRRPGLSPFQLIKFVISNIISKCILAQHHARSNNRALRV